VEKAYRHFGHDITDEDHVLEAGLGFAVKLDKGDFLGREAVLRKRDAGFSRRLMQFRLTDPDAHLHHNEPLLRDGCIVGHLTPGGYGHALGGSIGIGYIPCSELGESVEAMLASAYAVEIAGRRIAAEASLTPMYDPQSLRPRA
jgi:4-methylaminobutanoate oxidase (formaldehyde-forming)